MYLERHLSQHQQRSLNLAEEKHFQRPKRTKKKTKAQRQIKTKHARSIQVNSHNKHLYIHHRLAKQVTLTPAKTHFLRSPPPAPLYTLEALHALLLQHRQRARSKPFHSGLRDGHPMEFIYDPYIDETPFIYDFYQHHPSRPFGAFTLNQFNIPDEPSYDDEMINFLLETQNRDLYVNDFGVCHVDCSSFVRRSPEDYEMLLRLDERIQRKTVTSDIIESLPVMDVDQLRLNDQCSICMENYQLGQKLRRLPCEHLFHSDCIERYLREFSTQCPLDNLPLN